MSNFTQFINQLSTIPSAQLMAYYTAIGNEFDRRLTAVQAPITNPQPRVPESVPTPVPAAKPAPIKMNKVPVDHYVSNGNITDAWFKTPYRYVSDTQKLEFLQHFVPRTMDKPSIIKHIRFFLCIIEEVSGSEAKASVCRHLFSFIEKNEEFLRNHSKFRYTVVQKIEEFEADTNPHAVNIAKEFAWMKVWPWVRPKSQCSYCTKAVNTDVDDTGENFCNEDCAEAFSLNGDCVHDPTLTKEQLDKELDDMIAEKEEEPKTGYSLFAETHLKEVQRQNPSLNAAGVAQILKKMWEDCREIPVPSFREVTDYENEPSDYQHPSGLIQYQDPPKELW